MAQLPADRTKLAQAQSNMAPSFTASSQKLKDALTEAYDTIDTLNQKVDNHGSNATLPHPDKSVTRPKLADKVVGAEQLDDAAVTLVKMADESKDSANHTYSGAVPAVSTKTALDTLQTQLTQAIQASAPSEVSDSRISAKTGAIYPTLKARLDAEQSLHGFIRAGLIKLPADFPFTLPFDLYRVSSGEIKHTYDITKDIVGTEIFVNGDTGNDTNDGLTTGTAVRGLTKAVQIANAHADSNIIISITSQVLSRAYSQILDPITKNITIRAKNAFNEVILASNEYKTALTWTTDGTAFKATRSAVIDVADINYRDYRGMPKLLKKVNSVAACQAEKGTYYTDNVTVWVRRFGDENMTDGNVLVLISTTGIDADIGNKRLVMENLKWMKTTANDPGDNCVRVKGTTGSKWVTSNCMFARGARNGAAALNVSETYHFNSTAPLNGSDGFNYHGVGTEFAFEYNCHAYGNGVRMLDGVNTNNATTAHDGMTVLRVGSIGYDCKGPILADVNGCYSYNLDCTMYDSTRDAGAAKAAFYFDEAGASKQGKAYLINCGGGGLDTYTINTDGLVDVYVQNLKGNAIPGGVTLNLLT